ncbi:hypothetical protein D9M72_614920 [compost metagenome]
MHGKMRRLAVARGDEKVRVEFLKAAQFPAASLGQGRQDGKINLVVKFHHGDAFTVPRRCQRADEAVPGICENTIPTLQRDSVYGFEPPRRMGEHR